MTGAGINSGDYVIIRKSNVASDGQIVAAMVEGGECTLKRYYPEPENRRIRLHPENDSMQDMYFKEIEIQGVAVKLIKGIG